MKQLQIFLLSLFLSSGLFAQKIDGNSIEQVYEAPDVSAEALFSEIHYVLSLIFQDVDVAIKYMDKPSKRIVVKALALVPVLDAYKLMNPNVAELSDYIDYSHNYTLIIKVKDGKYWLKMSYQDGKYSDAQLTEYKLPFAAKMDFDETDLEQVIKKARIEMGKDYYSMTGRKKKEIYIQSQPRVLQEYQKTLINYSTIFFQSLHKKVLEGFEETDW